jgi:hypothetical protein
MFAEILEISLNFQICLKLRKCLDIWSYRKYYKDSKALFLFFIFESYFDLKISDILIYFKFSAICSLSSGPDDQGSIPASARFFSSPQRPDRL